MTEELIVIVWVAAIVLSIPVSVMGIMFRDWMNEDAAVVICVALALPLVLMFAVGAMSICIIERGGGWIANSLRKFAADRTTYRNDM